MAYLAYLEVVATRLPPGAAALFRAVDHARLDGPATLHDAWVDALTIHEQAEADDPMHRVLEIELHLPSPGHDRWFVLTYVEVAGYSLSALAAYTIRFVNRTVPSSDTVSQRNGHGDLFVHELRRTEHKTVEHELHFAWGATWMIECGDIRFRQEASTSG